MRHLKRYGQLFESQQELTQEQKDWLDECTKGTWPGALQGTWEVNPQTGLVDVEGNFDCSYMWLEDFKGVRFGRVNLHFNCSNNSLTSLEGAPQRVDGYFNCSHNELESLKGCPKYVGRGFDCGKNKLKSLKDAPDYVGEHFDCSRNELTSLEGAPNRVNGYFQCSYNRLKSLKYAPEYVKRDFKCSNNRLTSLEGIPQSVGEGFLFDDNPISGLVSQDAIWEVIKRMKAKKISLEQAVAEVWDELPGEDKAYLAKHHPDLSPEEKRIYRAIELNTKRR